MNASTQRYRAADLVAFARGLFAASGCDGDKPALIAEMLVEADLMGHTTHGLQLAGGYLQEIAEGRMKAAGSRIVADRGAAVTWDGGTLPGVWLTVRAVDLASSGREAMGSAPRHPPQPSHRLPRHLLPRAAAGMMVTILSPIPLTPAWRRSAVQGCVHAGPHRRRHPTGGDAIPDRHERVDHHQRHDQPSAA
jgi:L-lactate dehydrogenase